MILPKFTLAHAFLWICLSGLSSCKRTELPAGGNAVDVLTFGDVASERAHQLVHNRAEHIRGGLNETAIRLLPLSPPSFEGGTVAFTMKVDPVEQNYITVKLWGSDKGQDSGRLVLFSNGLQIGYRMESDYDVLNQTDEEGQAPGRFVYVTLPLPTKLTEGKTSMDLKIASLGRIWYYGRNFEQYQKALPQPTRGIYCAYTHTDLRFVPSPSEKQGAMPPMKRRPKGSDEAIKKSKEFVKERVAKLLNSSGMPNDHKALSAELTMLAEAYLTPWTPAYRDSRVIERIIRGGDFLAENFAKDPKFVEREWIGAGPLGQAVMLTWPGVEGQLNAQIKLGNTSTSRREAWVKTLRESIDYWRTHRRAYTNQSMIVDINIYMANRALQLIDPGRALPEPQALSYVYQSVGLEPWVGSDLPGGGSEMPFGSNYVLLTRKSLSRELGYVASYGETILPFACEMAALLHDKKFQDQVRKMQLARHYFRYPGFDADGYACMKLAAEIDNRTAHYPQSDAAYNSTNVREAWWMETAALLPDEPAIVGAAQQSIEDGQYFSYIEKRVAKKDPDTLGMMRNIENWEKVKKLPPSSERLPMTPGQPDFVFADEENGIIAIKDGESCLFINLYYRAERAVNRVARVFEQTSNTTRIATVRTNVEVIGSGQYYERPDWIDRIRSKGIVPPGVQIHQAWAGERMPISKRPDDAKSPKYGDWGPFLGKAAFYSLQYGEYLIGMNTTETNTYELKVPWGDGVYSDLVSTKEIQCEGGVVKVPPLSTVILRVARARQF